MTEKLGDEPQQGDGSGNGSGNGGNGGAGFASIDFDGDEPDSAVPFLPETCDLFPNFTTEDVERMRREGRSPTTVRVLRFANGRRVTIAGGWPIELASTQWLAQNFGQGCFDVQCLDQGNLFMKQKRHDLQAAPPHMAPQQANPGAGGYPPQGYGPPPGGNYPPQPAYGYPPQAPPGWYPPAAAPQKDTTLQDLMKVIALQVTAQSQQLNSSLKVAEFHRDANKPDEGMQALMMELLKDSLKKPKKESGGMGDVKNVLAVLELGGKLGAKGDGMADLEWWQEFLPTLMESCGPGAIALVAHATLKDDKAKNVVDLMDQHLKQKSSIDTDGTSVP